MGFFENLGRKVGRFTHEAREAADGEAKYACEDCGERFYADRATCPECGSEDVTELAESTRANAGDAAGSDDPADAEDVIERE